MSGDGDEAAPRVRRGRIKFWAKLALTALILTLVVRTVGGDKVRDAIKRLPPDAWLLCVVAFLATHCVAVFKWRAFVRLTGGRLGIADAFRCYAAGLFANLFLPSMIGGDVARAGLAMQATRQKEAVILGSLLDRLSDFFGLALLASGGLLALPSALAESGGSAEVGRRILGGFGIAALCGLALLVVVYRLRPPSTWPTKLRYTLLRAALALRKAGGRKLVVLGIVSGAAALQSVFLFTHAALGGRMGLDAGISVWFVCWPLAKIAAMLPVSVGGIGVREAAFAGLCARFGVQAETATAASLAWQGVLITGSLVAGAYWTLASRLRARGGSTPRPNVASSAKSTKAAAS